MRNISILTAVMALLSAGMVNAATANKLGTFSLYVSNNTPYVVHVGKTFYSKTPLKLLVTTLAPFSKEVKIADVDQQPSSDAPVSFYARVGKEQGYWTTPLVRYALKGDKKEVFLEPHRLRVDDKEFVTEVWAYGPDQTRSIILSIDPSPNATSHYKIPLTR